jgi:hypothetical protein
VLLFILAFLSPINNSTHCAEDFQVETRKSPVAVDSRSAFAQWLCAQHNIVNKKIGKVRRLGMSSIFVPLFLCLMDLLVLWTTVLLSLLPFILCVLFSCEPGTSNSRHMTAAWVRWTSAGGKAARLAPKALKSEQDSNLKAPELIRAFKGYSAYIFVLCITALI